MENIILISSNIRDYSQFMSGVKVKVIENLNIFNPNTKRIGIVWTNNNEQMPFGKTQMVINKTQLYYFTVEMVNYLSQYNNIIVDLITCSLNLSLITKDLTVLASILPTITFNYSLSPIGNEPRGNWIMDSSGESIDTIYFNENIYKYPHILDEAEYSTICTSNGNFYITGDNGFGQLGLGNNTDTNNFTSLPMPPNYSYNQIREIIHGRNHTLMLMTDGVLFGVGRNELYGQFGFGTRTNYSTFIQIATNVKTIKTRGPTIIMEKLDGSFYGSGSNAGGQLGIGNYTYQTTFQLITPPTGTVREFYLGYLHTVFLMTNNKIYVTGQNEKGQLGVPGIGNGTNTFTEITLPDSKIADSIYLGNGTTIFLTTDNMIYGCGDNSNGELGIGNQDNQLNIVQLSKPPNKQIQNIYFGRFHVLLLMTDGTLYGSGSNSQGQLGLGADTTSVSSWTRITIPYGYRIF